MLRNPELSIPINRIYVDLLTIIDRNYCFGLIGIKISGHPMMSVVLFGN